MIWGNFLHEVEFKRGFLNRASWSIWLLTILCSKEIYFFPLLSTGPFPDYSLSLSVSVSHSHRGMHIQLERLLLNPNHLSSPNYLSKSVHLPRPPQPTHTLNLFSGIRCYRLNCRWISLNQLTRMADIFHSLCEILWLLPMAEWMLLAGSTF